MYTSRVGTDRPHLSNTQIMYNAVSAKLSKIATEIQQLANRHFTTVFFGVSAAGTAFLAPKLFLVGVVVGLAGSRIIESQLPLPHVATRVSSALELVGLVGTAICYPYPTGYMVAFPLGAGVVAGHYLYTAFRKFVPLQPKAE